MTVDLDTDLDTAPVTSATPTRRPSRAVPRIVVRGNPDPAELAALLVALAGAGRRQRGHASRLRRAGWPPPAYAGTRGWAAA
jgi:Acyl-CoA carboxylase epsilon subunit